MTEETTFDKLKNGLLELLRGYPDYRFYGKIEYFLGNGQSSLEVLEKDKIIELASKKEAEKLNKKLLKEQWDLLLAEGKSQPVWYRLTSKGVDLSISMINLEHSERILKYSKEMRIFTIVIIFLTALTLVFSIF